MGQLELRRIVIALSSISLILGGVVLGTGSAASAATSVSTRYLLRHLNSGLEHSAGYSRSKFRLWIDADADGCDTRDEVLVQEAVARPRVSAAGCLLAGGDWRSRYDGLSTTDPSTFDIDHLVPLNEAWQSGAWRWSTETRQRFANDLGYRASLIAVSAHSNRSKGDKEPQAWMPQRTRYGCTYLKSWVAVKWRWHLRVNSTERAFLASKLKACGWPRVPRPARASVVLVGSSSTPLPTPIPTPTEPTDPPVTPTPAPTTTPGNPGNAVNCGDFTTWDAANAWYQTYYPLYGDVAQLDADDDGIPCETLPGAP